MMALGVGNAVFEVVFGLPLFQLLETSFSYSIYIIKRLSLFNAVV